jgi:hypothetical protein
VSIAIFDAFALFLTPDHSATWNRPCYNLCGEFHEVGMKRLGIAAIIVVGLVIGIEGTLTVLRQWNVAAKIEAQNPQSPSVSATATAIAAALGPAEATALASATLMIGPEGTVTVRVNWDYRIGPRFPMTVVQAEALDESSKIVALTKYTIDCGTSSLQCDGGVPISLEFGVVDKQGTRSAWPPGNYTIRVTRAYVGYDAKLVTERQLQVLSQ